MRIPKDLYETGSLHVKQETKSKLKIKIGNQKISGISHPSNVDKEIIGNGDGEGIGWILGGQEVFHLP